MADINRDGAGRSARRPRRRARTLRPRRNRRSGAALLMFLLVALPLVFLGSALAVDVTRIIVTSRQVSNAAEAAAVAGAQQFKRVAVTTPCGDKIKDGCYQYSLDLDKQAARQFAAFTILLSKSQRAITADLPNNSTNITVTENGYGTERVKVSVRYTVEGLVFIPAVNLFFGDTSRDQTLQITRYADVCTSRATAGAQTYAPTGGNCTRPNGPIID